MTSTVSEPTDVAVNPNNPAQRYILWGNGRVDAVGGAPAITVHPDWTGFNFMPVGVALHITDWTTGQGYVLDLYGAFQGLNGAPTLGSNGALPGVPYTNPTRMYVDWSWDPAGSGMGVVLDQYGQLYPFNGAPTPPRTGPRWGYPAAKKLVMDWSTPTHPKAITLDWYGGLQIDYAATEPTGYPYWAGWDAARDLVMVDWSTNSGYVLDLYGGIHPFGSAAVTPLGEPYMLGVDVGRCLAVPSTSNPTTFWTVWAQGQQNTWSADTAPAVVAGAGVNAQQTVTITGSPTGGSFKLVYGAQTTAAIAYNATAATVQTALQALSSIGSGNAVVTGGPGPGTPYTVTFQGTLAAQSITTMTTSTVAFTGGTSPTVTVATVTQGVPMSPPASVTTTTQPTLAWSYSDSFNNSQSTWQVYIYTQTWASGHDMSDPSAWAANATFYASGVDGARRGVIPSVDLVDDNYVFYVRAQDTAGVWSAWSNRAWTQAVPAPATPTGMTAMGNEVTMTVALSVNCTTGGSANTVCFQFSNDGGVTWTDVRGAEVVTLQAVTAVTDFDPALGVDRKYRAYTYNTSPRVVSGYSNVATATIRRCVYALTSTADATLGGEIFVVDTPTFTRNANAGVFDGVGAKYPTVVSDGVPKSRRQTLGIECDGTASWAMVEALIESNSTLVYRDPFGDVTYCRIAGQITRTQQWKRPRPGDQTPLHHNHIVQIPIVEIAQPTVLAIGSTTPPGPVQVA